MLKLTGCVRLCVDIGNLFELQRPFHSDRVLIATAKEQCVMLVRETFRQRFDALIQ
ncbi:hypothetical protein D3C75_1239720 [compost metagenome]